MTWQEEIPRLLLELGYFTMKVGLFEESQTLLGGVAELRPDDPIPRLFQGMLWFARSEYRKAEDVYRQLLNTHPDFHLAKVYLAESLMAQRRWSEAERLLSEVLSGIDDGPEVTFARELLNGLRKGLFQRGLQHP